MQDDRYPGFRPTRDGIENVAEKLENITVTENDTMVLDLISNVAFMGTDKDGLPTPSVKGGDGKYHVPGMLTTAPPTTLKKNLEGCNAIADSIKMANVILICPAPLCAGEVLQRPRPHRKPFEHGFR